jgi:hypothetical protein
VLSSWIISNPTLKITQLTNLPSQNLALSRTYWDFFKHGISTITSKTRSTGNNNTHPSAQHPNGSSGRASNSYALHSLGKSKHSKNSSHPMSASTLTHNSSKSPTWDGSHNKSSQVQIHGRRNSSSAESDETDELPLHGGRYGYGSGNGMGNERDAVGGGIERKIEFSVEADERSGCGESGWERDLERDGASEGDVREVRMGRGL